LNFGLEVIQGHWRWQNSTDHSWLPISPVL